jgi:hypothetical protein
MQAGFTFPWTADVLMPRTKVFASSELPQDQPAGIAQSGDWVVVSAGVWTIYLRAGVGSFPKLSKIVPDVSEAKARCQLSKDDIRFLAETLPQLPGNDAENCPVTIDVNGQITVRARADDQTKPTEVVLTNSQSTGKPIRINTNRMYLATSLRLGLSDLCVYGKDSALRCQGFERKYVWMPLDGDGAIKPTDNVVRIESPQGEVAAPITQPTNPKSETPVSDPTSNTTVKATTTTDTPKKRVSRRKASQQEIGALIDQAVQFRSALHALVQQSNGLVKALKEHKRQSKAIQSTLASLKQLQNLGV